MLAGTASVGNVQEDWFLELLKKLRVVLELKGREDAKVVLEEYAWSIYVQHLLWRSGKSQKLKSDDARRHFSCHLTAHIKDQELVTKF